VLEAAGSVPPGVAGELPPAHSPSLASSCGTSASRRRREFMSTASWDSTCRRASVEIWVVWFHLQHAGDLRPRSCMLAAVSILQLSPVFCTPAPIPYPVASALMVRSETQWLLELHRIAVILTPCNLNTITGRSQLQPVGTMHWRTHEYDHEITQKVAGSSEVNAHPDS